jgi:integrase
MPEWTKTKSLGVRYRLHKTRKHGVGYDRYFVIRYKLNGKDRGEGVGWGSEGMTEKKAAAILAELRTNQTNGTPPFTLAEKRQMEDNRREEATQQAEAEKVKNMTFAEIWNDSYYPFIQANRRSQRAIETEELLFRLWINPVIGNLPLAKIATLPHIEKLKKAMKTAGKSPRTVRYALDIVRQVFNHADLKNIYRGRNPAAGRQVKRPQEDNRRNRSLSPAESDTLLSTLLKHSQDVHDMAMLSLHAGLRYGEVASLKWGDVDTFAGQGVLKDTKSGKNRPFYMTPAVRAMFAKRQTPKCKPGDLVFPDRNGNQQPKISRTFRLVADELFNQSVTDPRNKVVFHSLRRTFATQLLNQGTSIYHIQRLLGHADISTTTRYLDADGKDLKDAVLKAQQG